MKTIRSPLDRCFVADLLVSEHAAYSGRCKVTFSLDVLFSVWSPTTESQTKSFQNISSKNLVNKNEIAQSCQQEWNLVSKNEIKRNASRPSDSEISNAKTKLASLHLPVRIILTTDIEMGWRGEPPAGAACRIRGADELCKLWSKWGKLCRVQTNRAKKNFVVVYQRQQQQKFQGTCDTRFAWQVELDCGLLGGLYLL